jgi:hypothetical protein
MSAARVTALRAQAVALRAQADAIEAEATALVAERQPAKPPEPVYMKVEAYGARVGLSRRTVFTRIDEGLPTIGQGKSRRVDVARADAWLGARGERVDNAIEMHARCSARMAKAGAR